MTRPRPIRTATEHAIEVPRTTRYHVLGDSNRDVDELWIVLHGIGQLAGDFVEYFSVLDDPRRVVAAPEALSRYYTTSIDAAPAAERNVGATWMTREFREREIADYVRYLDLVHAELAARHRPRRTILIGFSQGGATAARWATMGTAKLDEVVLWGAAVPPDLPLPSLNDRLRGAPLTIVIGRTDQYISSAAVDAERGRLDAAGVKYDLVQYDAGHSIKRAVLLDLAARFSTR